MDNDQTRDWAAQRFAPHTFVGDRGSLPFRLHAPTTVRRGRRHPLLLLMHGAGSLGSDNLQQLFLAGLYASQPQARLDDLFIVAPQCPVSPHWIEHGDSWQGTDFRFSPVPTAPMALCLELLDTLLEDLPVDRRRLAVGGGSMGGYATWDLLARRPGLFCAAFPICGAADPATAPQAAKTHLWITHGEQDTCVLPDSARRMADALRQLGADLHHTEFPGVAHDAWTPTLTDPDFHRWLNAHLFPDPENTP